LEIDNTNRTTGGGTTIKAGKYISDKTMLAVIQQLGANSTTQFTLEYQFRRNLQLILTQSDDSRTGIDILWRHDY
jgi:autotransporter translocation and assembly factor TamB